MVLCTYMYVDVDVYDCVFTYEYSGWGLFYQVKRNTVQTAIVDITGVRITCHVK